MYTQAVDKTGLGKTHKEVLRGFFLGGQWMEEELLLLSSREGREEEKRFVLI